MSTRTPTRTDLVEAHQEEVQRLVARSVDAKTDARAYRDLGDFISTFPPATPFHAVAASELCKLAHNQARNLTSQAEALAQQADELRARGIQ